MANSDFLIRAKADTKNYDANLAKAKQQLDNFAKANMSAGGVMKQMSSQLVSAAAKFASFGAAVAGSMKLVKDAFNASEASVDEWGRTLEATKSVYEGFLNAINNGDISGYLGRIDEIVKAAKEAYNELDKLGSMKTIQAPQISGQQLENERIRMMIQTRRYIAPQDGRGATPGMKNGQLLTDEQVRILEKQLQGGMQKLTTLVGNEIQQSNSAISAMYDRQAIEAGLSKKEFLKGTSSWEEFSKRAEGAKRYREVESEKAYIRSLINSGHSISASQSALLKAPNPNAEFKGWDVFRVDGERYAALVQLIQERDQQISQVYSTQSQAFRAINRAEGITSRVGKGGKGGSGGGGGTETVIPADGSIAAQEAEVSRLTDLWKNATDQAGRDGYLKQLNDAKAVLDEMLGKTKEIKAVEMSRGFAGLSEASLSAWTNSIKEQLDNAEIGSTLYQSLTAELADANALGNLIKTAIENGIDLSEGELSSMMESLWADLLNPEGISDDSLNKLVERINEYMKEHPISLDLKTGTVSTDNSNSKESTRETYATDSFGKISSGINSMVSSMEQLGVEIPTGLKEVLGGINAITSILTTITAIMEAIEAIQSATSFFPFFAKSGIVPHAAKGFLIPGNDYSDRTPILAQSGELILNRAAQGNIASQLQGAQRASTGGTPYVNGEQIYLGLTNYLRRSGKGELLTARQ